MPTEKVYVINEPTRAASKERRASAGNQSTAAPNQTTNESQPGRSQPSRLAALRGYVLGPLSLIIWPRGRGRVAWAIVAAASLAGLTLGAVQWGALKHALSSTQHGAVLWASLVTVGILCLATTWCRAILIHPIGAGWPQGLRSGASVGVLGLLFPGLGLLIAGRRCRAAAAFWSVGLVALGMTVLVNWRWLAAQYQNAGAGAIAADDIIAVAVGALVIGALAWLVQTLDGVRLVSPSRRSGRLANALGMALILVSFAGLATFRPNEVAAELGTVAAPLRAHGLNKLSLKLYEAASFLDPVTPDYLAAAGSLGEELGMVDLAAAKQTLLEKRAAEFADALGAELVTASTDESSPTYDLLPLAADPHYVDERWHHITSPIQE